LVYHNNSLNSIILGLLHIYLTMAYSHLLILLAILVSPLTKILSFAQHISAISQSCFHNIRDLRRIRNTIDQTTACTIAISRIYSKIDYCNSLLLILPATQTNCHQLVLNSAARAVTKTPKLHHITPILKSLYWLKIHERIKYKVLSLTYKSLKLVNILTFALFFHFLHVVVLDHLLLLPLVALLSPLVLKEQIGVIIIMLLFYRTLTHLIYVTLFITLLLLY